MSCTELTCPHHGEANRATARCHTCGHWRATYCNADGFCYCDSHYPEGFR